LVAQAYEALQLTLVEEFSGVTAYSRPLSAHLVKDTDWSSATITEPRPFVNTTSTYGLRLATDETHWFLSMPSGLWRAPRLPADPLDLTPYIVELHQAVNDAQPGSLILQLDNSSLRQERGSLLRFASAPKLPSSSDIRPRPAPKPSTTSPTG